MKCNVGGIDRVLRIVIGLALVVLTMTGIIGVWGWLGVIAVATGLIGFCPLYPLLGLNSCRSKDC